MSAGLGKSLEGQRECATVWGNWEEGYTSFRVLGVMEGNRYV